MKSIITLGKKQVTEFLMAYNKGVKSTFGLQKSRHQFAQALGFTNWFFLEAELEESSDQILYPARKHRISEQYLDFEVRLPKPNLSVDFLVFLKLSLRNLLEEGAIENIDNEVLQQTFLKKLTEGLSEDEAPSFMEVMEWYDVEESFEEENVFSYAFRYGEWDDQLVKRLVDGVLKPAFEHFKRNHEIQGEFLGAEIFREFQYQTKTKL